MKVEMLKRCRAKGKMREIGDVIDVPEDMARELLRFDKAQKVKVYPRRTRRIRTPEQKYTEPKITDPGVDEDARSPADS